MPKEINLAFKVGMFVIAAVVILMMVVVSISDFSFFEKGKPVAVVFGFANGLKKAAPVRLAGVDAGLIKDLKIFVDDKDNSQAKVKVDVWIKEGFNIPVDSKVTINQLGLLGEKYVEITPGKATEYYSVGSVIVGQDPVPMDRITERIDQLTAKLEETMDNVNRKVLTDKNAESLQAALEGVSVIVTNMKDGKGTIGKFMSDDSIYNNLQELSGDLKANPWKLLYRPKAAR